MRRIGRWIVIGLSLAVCSACMNPGFSASSRTHYFLLVPTLSDHRTASVNQDAVSGFLGVGPIALPPYVDRPQLVTRLGENEVRVADFHHWAEPLKENIVRVLVANLSALVGARSVHAYPWNRSEPISLHIPIDFLRFDADENGKVTLSAFWRIVDVETKRSLVKGRFATSTPTPSPDIGQAVQAMSRNLAALCVAIANAIQDIDR